MVGLHVSFLSLSNSDQNKLLVSARLSPDENINIDNYLLANEILLKLGFTASLHFIIDNTLTSYLQFLGKGSCKKAEGILEICRCLLEEKLEWDHITFDCRIFNFFRLIRNSLHNNGVHIARHQKEKMVSVEYKGKAYLFEDGKRIDFVTWDLLLDIADDMRILLFHLSNNKTIRSIPGLLSDKFAI